MVRCITLVSTLFCILCLQSTNLYAEEGTRESYRGVLDPNFAAFFDTCVEASISENFKDKTSEKMSEWDFEAPKTYATKLEALISTMLDGSQISNFENAEVFTDYQEQTIFIFNKLPAPPSFACKYIFKTKSKSKRRVYTDTILHFIRASFSVNEVFLKGKERTILESGQCGYLPCRIVLDRDPWPSEHEMLLVSLVFF